MVRKVIILHLPVEPAPAASYNKANNIQTILSCVFQFIYITLHYRLRRISKSGKYAALWIKYRQAFIYADSWHSEIIAKFVYSHISVGFLSLPSDFNRAMRDASEYRTVKIRIPTLFCNKTTHANERKTAAFLNVYENTPCKRLVKEIFSSFIVVFDGSLYVCRTTQSKRPRRSVQRA